MASSPTLPRIRFSRPDELPPPEELAGRVVVLDLAFDATDPARTSAWIEALGERLILWVDHHEEDRWRSFAEDERFLLVPRAEAPACPPLITPEIVALHGPAEQIVCHGDFDGVMAAAKWCLLQEGSTVPEWLDRDSVVADTRKGTLSDRGQELDDALHGGRGDAIRHTVLGLVLDEGRGDPPDEWELQALRRATSRFREVRVWTAKLADEAAPLEDLPEDAVFVDLLPVRHPISLTLLLGILQRKHDWVVVRALGRNRELKIVVGTDPARSGLDLRQEFGVQGYAPFRIRVDLEQLRRRLPSCRFLV